MRRLIIKHKTERDLRRAVRWSEGELVRPSAEALADREHRQQLYWQRDPIAAIFGDPLAGYSALDLKQKEAKK